MDTNDAKVAVEYLLAAALKSYIRSKGVVIPSGYSLQLISGLIDTDKKLLVVGYELVELPSEDEHELI